MRKAKKENAMSKKKPCDSAGLGKDRLEPKPKVYRIKMDNWPVTSKRLGCTGPYPDPVVPPLRRKYLR